MNGAMRTVTSIIGLSVFKQMGQMFGLAKGVFLRIIFMLRGVSLIVQTTFSR